MDWFDKATTAATLVIGIGGIGYYAWKAVKSRALSTYASGQIMILFGFLVLMLPPKVYSLPEDGRDDFFLVGAALVAIGFGLVAWHRYGNRSGGGSRTSS